MASRPCPATRKPIPSLLLAFTAAAGCFTYALIRGGEASAVLARRPGLSLPVHEAFAVGLDQTLLVAMGLGIIGALAVFAFVRTPAAAPPASPATSASGTLPGPLASGRYLFPASGLRTCAREGRMPRRGHGNHRS